MPKCRTGESRMSRRNNTLRLNRANRRLAGVCAGMADYLEVPAFLVRVIYVLMCMAWAMLILAYPITWWWLKNREEHGSDFMSGSKVANHLRRIDYHKQLYRNPARARIAGVCSGIADYLEISSTMVRVLTLLSFFIFGPFTFFVYLVFWIALEKNPEETGRRGHRFRHRRSRRAEQTHAHFRRSMGYGADDSQHADREGFVDDPHPQDHPQDAGGPSSEAIAMSLKECSAAFRTVESRLRDVEAFITSKRFRLHCEINRI